MTKNKLYILSQKITSYGDIEKLQLSFLYLLSFSLPFYQKWSSAIIIILAAVSFLQILKTKKIYNSDGLWIPVALFTVYTLSLLLSDNKDFTYIENRIVLIAFPFIFIALNPTHLTVKKIVKYFIYGCGVALAANYIIAIYTSLSFTNGQLLLNPVVNDEFSFLYSVVRDGNHFFGDLFSVFHQSTYFAYYLNFAIAGILAFSLIKNRKTYAILAILFAIALFQLSSKIGIILLVIQLLFFTILKIKKIALKILVSIIILLSSIFVFSINPRGSTMLDNFKNYQLNYSSAERFGYSLRLMSWKSSIELIKENPIWGVGLGDVQNYLDAKYSKNEFSTPLKQHLNSHNQFMQLYVECGLLGIVILLALFLKLYNYSSIRSKQGILTLLFFILAFISFFFESTFNRYAGISFFIFFFLILSNSPRHKS